MKSQRESDPLQRFAIYRRDLDSLLRRYAPHEPARAELEMLIRNMQAALRRGLPLLARARTAERRARIDHLKSLEKALGACAKLLVERTASKQHTVGRLIGAEIARSLTNDAYRSVGIAIGLSLRYAEMIRARAREPDAEIASEERRLRGTRSAESPRVLANLLVSCRAHVLAQLAVEQPTTGGRLSHPEREYVIASLASAFQDIFGFAPTAGTWKREHGGAVMGPRRRPAGTRNVAYMEVAGQLRANGYSPIPLVGKTLRIGRWPHVFCERLPSMNEIVEEWSMAHIGAHVMNGVGVATAHGLVIIDVDDDAAVGRVLTIVPQAHKRRPVSGSAGARFSCVLQTARTCESARAGGTPSMPMAPAVNRLKDRARFMTIPFSRLLATEKTRTVLNRFPQCASEILLLSGS